ncbi:glycosyltransferase [Defluviitalea raffinosedens]|uniref:Glycosyltransferase n=2 Tax=Defluviitalea raffinosedens TaxID=1450156 RepID=A0A7C8LK64_9FIRM|nr:glycosyltransferase [Defluviitalea raffinosedens]
MKIKYGGSYTLKNNKHKSVLYICFIQNYFNTLIQRTHHIVQYMTKQNDIENIDIIYVKQDPEKHVDIFQEGKQTYYGISTIPAWKYGLGHISNPLKMFFRFYKINKKKYDYIVAESPWGGIVALMLKLFRKSSVVIYEDMDYYPGFYTKSKIRNIIVNMFEKIVMRHSDLIITVGQELRTLRRTYTKKEIKVIPNGVKFNTFYNGIKHKPEHDLTMIYMGKLDDWAGVDLPIKAMPQLIKIIPNIKYLIIGEGPSEKKLKEMAKQLGVEKNVEFLGLKSYEELPYYLSKADIGIATFQPIPLMKYAFTLKVVEYGAAGLPVIATRIGETKRYIEDYQTGLTISYDVQEFIDKVKMIFENKTLYDQLSNNGIKRAQELDWDNLLQNRYEIINKFLSEKAL